MHIKDVPVRGREELRAAELSILKRKEKIKVWFSNHAKTLIRDNSYGIFEKRVHVDDFRRLTRTMGKKLGYRKQKDEKMVQMLIEVYTEAATRGRKNGMMSQEEVHKEFALMSEMLSSTMLRLEGEPEPAQ